MHDLNLGEKNANQFFYFIFYKNYIVYGNQTSQQSIHRIPSVPRTLVRSATKRAYRGIIRMCVSVHRIDAVLEGNNLSRTRVERAVARELWQNNFELKSF